MISVIRLALVAALALVGVAADKGDPLGCFRLSPRMHAAEGRWPEREPCVNLCSSKYYHMALHRAPLCRCGEPNIAAEMPPEVCDRDEDALRGYSTGLRKAGPPRALTLSEISETGMRLVWEEPVAGTPSGGYSVEARPLRTFSPEPEALAAPTWRYSPETRTADLANLHPGTTYNVSASAVTAEGVGVPAFVVAETTIGEPEPAPPEPKILERRGRRLLIEIPPAVNYNGPVTKYRVVVSAADGSRRRGYPPSQLTSFEEAERRGLPYYIAAELDPEDIAFPFVVGDGTVRNGFLNAPLDRPGDVDVSIGIVSSRNSVTRTRYARASEVAVLDVGRPERESSAPVTLLAVGVAVGAILLALGLATIVSLRRKIAARRRELLSRTMPLRGPFVEIENAGYVPDEREKVDRYADLERRVWNIPRASVDVDDSAIVGRGTYGPFFAGIVRHPTGPIVSCLQSIADGRMSKAERRTMLGELDPLVRVGDGEGAVRLIGLCELPEVLYVAIEDCRFTFKEFLLSSRRLSGDRFSALREGDVLRALAGVCAGMNRLASERIVHGRLCCRNVVVPDGATPKVSGFGLSLMRTPEDDRPDYSRWTARETLRGNPPTVKGDVWSFGCLIWEALALGGTPLPGVPSKDVSDAVAKGARPSRLRHVGDDLYQLCLNCWQSDPDERPSFGELLENLNDLTFENSSDLNSLNFSHYNGFQYEIYRKELEMMT